MGNVLHEIQAVRTDHCACHQKAHDGRQPQFIEKIHNYDRDAE